MYGLEASQWQIQGGARNTRPLGPIFNFQCSCSFQVKLTKTLGWRPHLWSLRPPNPGSVTDSVIFLIEQARLNI